jgi:outer membrane murein-binding lipoprotein Lpp
MIFGKNLNWPALAIVAILMSGCGSPNKVNIDLRKSNQDLRDQVAQLQRQHSADTATITALQSHATTVPILPESQLEQLYTVAGLNLGSLTGGYKSDSGTEQAGDNLLRVQAVPTDQDGQPIKAAGTFHVELFDLTNANNNRIGSWDFDIQQAKANWLGSALMYSYMLPCPWQTPPSHPNCLVKVTFTDALTHGFFSAQKNVQLDLAPVKQAGK